MTATLPDPKEYASKLVRTTIQFYVAHGWFCPDGKPHEYEPTADGDDQVCGRCEQLKSEEDDPEPVDRRAARKIAQVLNDHYRKWEADQERRKAEEGQE